MLVIAVTGLKGSGKNTVANFLQAELESEGFKVGQFALADGVRDFVSTIDPIVDVREATDHHGRGLGFNNTTRYNEAIAELTYDVAKLEYPEIRRLLQKLGTELFRDRVSPDFWVRILVEKLDDAAGLDVALITDVRFPNEARGLEERFRLYGLRVERPGLKSDGHASEQPELVFRYSSAPVRTIINDGTLDQLEAKVTSAVRDLKENL